MFCLSHSKRKNKIETNETRKSTKTKKYQAKQNQNIKTESFGVGQLLLGLRPDLWCGYTLCEILFEQQIFPLSARRYQLQISPWLGMELCVHFLLMCWDFVWFEFVKVSDVLSQTLCVHICIILAVSGKYCFPFGFFSHPHCYLTYFPPLYLSS